MQKVIVLLLSLFLLTATSLTIAKSENSNQGNNSSSGHGQSKKDASASATTPSASCDPSLNWRNHGAYVSCVAKLHQGGAEVSEAARSDVGKKHASASGSIKPSPTASSSASSSASPTASESGGLNNLFVPVITGLINSIQSLLDNLKHLFGL